MFIPFDDIQSIIKDAHSDLGDFLQDHLNVPDFIGDLKKARDEAKKHDDTFIAATAEDLQDFIEPFLEWLEERRESEPPKLPWETDDTYEPSLPHESKCRKFLINILDRLQRLIEPSGDSLKIQNFGNQVSKSLEDFGRFTASKLNCILSYNDYELQWGKFPGFASWLVVGYDEDQSPTGDLYIISNINKIESLSKKNINTQARRFEKTYLHELGHARTNIQYYFTAPLVNGVVYSRPEHETRAWLYSYAIRAFISSPRARISRLLRKGDNEWK